MSRRTIEPRLLKVEEAAARLEIPPSKALAMARRGDLPAVQIGRRDPWRIDRLVLEKRFEYFKEIAAIWLWRRAEGPRATSLSQGEANRIEPAPPAGRSAGDGCLGCSREAGRIAGKVKARIKDGTFRASKPGRTWQVSVEDVQAALNDKGLSWLFRDE